MPKNPTPNAYPQWAVEYASEITLRDLYKMAALSGLGEVVWGLGGYSDATRSIRADEIACYCGEVADAMLREREKPADASERSEVQG